MDFYVLIPARLASTRLPRKLLREIKGKPILQYTYERACKSGAKAVIIATDSTEIEQYFSALGAEVCLTADCHQTGTDRLAEAAKLLQLEEDAILVNVQGDEPLIPPKVIHQVAQNLAKDELCQVATLCKPILDAESLFNPNLVKVVRDSYDHACYFSRAPIPWDRDIFAASQDHMPTQSQYFGHIGIYAYRAKFLQQYSSWDPCDLENTEKLEQLRILWHGHKIHVAEACEVPPIGVDTEEDFLHVKRLLEVGDL